MFLSPWVSASPPQITVQPQKWTVTEGGSYTFTVTAGGTAPLSFQWRKDNVDLADKTNSTLPLTLIQTNAAGLYTVVITNLEGAVTSAPARLTVRLAGDPAHAPPQGGWAYLFGGDSAAGSLSAALDGTWDHSTDNWAGDGRGAANPPAGGIGTTNGILTIEDTVTSGSGFNNRRLHLTHNLAQETGVTNAGTLINDGVTLTFRARLTPATDPLLELTNAPNGLVNNSDGKGMFGIHQGGASGISIGFSLHQAVEDLSTTTSFTFAQAGLHLNNLNGDVRSSFVDPGEGGTTNILALDPAAFHEFWITVQDNGADPGTHRVSIYLDGSKTPTVFNVTAGVGTEGPAANYLALGMGSTAQRGAVDVDFFGYKPGVNLPSGFNEPVGIVSQPTNVFTATGQLASFSVGVTGTPPYGFQWYRDGSSLTDATNATYVTGPVVTSDNGAQFFVVITNDYGSVTSSVAGLSLLGPPSITAQPQSLTVTNGDSASFSVTANSQGTTTYQWRFGGNPVAGQTNTTFFLASAGPANAGNYDVVVSNPSGSVTSTLAVLTVVLLDFGDAPDPGFPTLKASNGARHRIVPGVFLGAAIDAEIDGQPEATAAGDDGSGADDEDGVTFGGPLRVGQTASVSVVASTNGFLNAWLDFNRNGSWTGAGEQVFTNVALVTGTNALSFPVPASASLGGAFARFRFSTAGGLSFDGPASDGEVEDYMVMLMAVANVGVSLTDSPDPVAATSNLTYTIVVTNAGPSAAADVDLSDALPAGATFVSALPSQGSCSLNAGVVSCDLGSLANNATVTVQLRLRPGASGPLTNSVSVANPDFDPVAGNNTASITTTVLDGPIITVQPQSLNVTNGNNATLSVTATGTLPLRYQWSFGGNPLAGATNATLVITNAQLAQSGDYAVRITNIVGVVDSQTATLTVLVPPSILTSPQSRTNLAGSVATLSVTAAGSEPLSYQWRFNVTNLLAGATNSSLVFNSVQSSNAGAYRVDVSNAAGVATSLVATLTVIEMDFGDAPGPYPTLLAANGARHRLVPGIRLGAAVDFEPDGQSGSNADGDDLNGLDDEDGVVFNTPLRIGQSVSVSVVASTNGVLNAWMDFGRDGSWGDPGDQIFTNRNLTAGTNTLTFLVPGGAVPGTTYARFRFGTTSGLGFTGEAPDGEVEDYALTVEAVAELAIHRLSALDPVAVDSNEVYSITLTNAGPAAATGVGLSDVLPPGITFISADTTQGACSQSSGLVSCSIGLLNPGGSATVTVTIKSGTAGSLTNSVSVGGNEADLTPANNLASIVSTIMQPPQITSPPQSQTVTNGGTAVFTVGVVGTAPRFQWRRDGVNLPGATNATLAVTNAQLSSEGSYSVQVTNEVGSATSSGVSLTVLAQVAIVTQPQSQTVGVGGTATFRVTATGSPPLFYQWDYNDVALPGETASNLVLTAVQTNQAGSYRVRVFNPSGSTTSAVVTLTVLFPPTFTQHPQSQTNLAGSSP
ncbi:MAG TPA: immunoglobulin domain-containing protein, partial [Candidatus Saccharimonadales bacterium]|nr:immunoglobulin domain-containing protein [Candidatus Saccharimonadales bacterium]